ncbi:MAG: dTDP-4-dehydrorhamnose 3,5-epimerase [Bacteroidales bacterium]|nr:dTDP-4-dehydrorhamnose 3,5-epimerase [Bacteroidales bacterium]
MIEGITLTPLKRIVGNNGDVLHALKATESTFCGFGEAYFSQVKTGVVKGWKRHNRMTLNIIVPVGAIRFVVYDDREGSITRGQFESIVISPDSNYQRLTLAPGLWMAFQGVAQETSMLLDIIPEPHDDTEGDRKPLEDIPFNFTI